MQTFGRKTIYASISEQELLSLDLIGQIQKIKSILEYAIPIHDNNRTESEYLWDYWSGIQDIYTDKVKHTRTEIDNKSVENWVYAFTEFKKANLLGEPIQYVNLSGNNNGEVDTLNNYCRYEGKRAKDNDLYEEILITGRGFRYNGKDTKLDDNEVPFEIINCEAGKTEAVYSSKLGNELLFTFIESDMQYTQITIDEDGIKHEDLVPYSEYTIYLRDKQLVFNDKDGELNYVEDSLKPIIFNKHLIVEYSLNKKRLSLIEIGKDIFNDINYLESLDKDDMEQFVNSIMIFTNAKIDENGLNMIKELGACSIKSTNELKASVDLLSQRLNATDTQVYYTRLLNALHQILGVPQANDNGNVVTGDTGKARLTGQGYLSAGIRIKNDEIKFGDSDLKSLDVLLTICKQTENSGIKSLKITNIQPQFQVDMSENLLVKTQSLQNLYDCDIPRAIANSVINLFPDANAVTSEQERLFGAQTSRRNNENSFGNNNTQQKVNEQNNNVRKVEQIENQGN